MTAPQACTKTITPRILAKLARPKNSPTQDQFTGKVASTTVKSGRKTQICQCSCPKIRTTIDTMAKSMQNAMSFALLIRSQPAEDKRRRYAEKGLGAQKKCRLR